MRTRILIVLIAMTIPLLTGSVQEVYALSYQVGDVFVSVGAAKVEQWRDVAGTMTFIQNIDCSAFFGGNAFTTGAAFDINSNLYITMFGSSGVCKVDSNGNPVGTFGAYGTDLPESILFNLAGNAFVGAAIGPTQDLYEKDSAGGAVNQFNTAVENVGTDWIDLAADQKTMFYTSEGRQIKRFDVNANAQLGDFVTLPADGGIAFQFRLLSGGGLVVSDNFEIKRLNAAGAVIDTYDVTGINGWFALNLNPSGTSFWAADNGFATSQVCEFDLGTPGLDNHLRCFSPNVLNTFGLVIFGENTAGSTTPKGALVGGDYINLDSTALYLAGITSNLLWILPVVGGMSGAGIYLVRSKYTK